MSDYYYFRDTMHCIVESDDRERFVDLCHGYPDHVGPHLVLRCAASKAKKCLTALVNGEACEPPPALDGCATVIHLVARFFPDLPDVVSMMLKRGAVKDLNIKYRVDDHENPSTPLQVVLNALCERGHVDLPLWSPGESIFKLIILLCLWEMKKPLDVARQFARYTDSINEIAWSFLEDGKLTQLAALLLVAQEKVMVPFVTGLTIEQLLTNNIDEISSEVDLNNEQAEYKCMLMDARALFDVFERTGYALSLYSISMLKKVRPDKVLVDVAGLLKDDGFSLQFVDLDLRDCYRGRPELWKANLFELADTPRPDNKLLHSYPEPRTALTNIFSRHWDPLIGRLKLREMLNLAASFPRPRPRLLSTVAGSSIPPKHLAYFALKLKRGIRYL